MKKKIILQLAIFVIVFQLIGLIIYYFFNERYFIPLLFSSIVVYIITNYKDLKQLLLGKRE